MKFAKLTLQQLYLLSIAPGEDIMEQLDRFVKEEGVRSGYILGIGAVTSMRVGMYLVARQKHVERKFRKPLELVNVTGIITKNKVHVHATFGSQLSKAYAGHLVRATVSAACEIIVVETKEEVTRKKNEKIGLELLDIK